MITATLYIPGRSAQAVSPEGLLLPDDATGYAKVTGKEAMLLACAPGLVDVLACGTGYTAYSVADYDEGPPNLAALEAINQLAGHTLLDSLDEDDVLRGPVLIISQS